MKGINRRQHEALKQSLQQLETLLGECTHQKLEVQQALHVLEQSYAHYQHLLDELAFHIIDYEELYREVKVNCLSSNLRQLLRELPKNSVDIHLLQESLKMAKAV